MVAPAEEKSNEMEIELGNHHPATAAAAPATTTIPNTIPNPTESKNQPPMSQPQPQPHGDESGDEQTKEADQEHSEFKVNAAFWRRAWYIFRLGLSTPWHDPKLWFVILLNVAAQILAGFDAQMHFYYTATGSGNNDPGMAGCLKNGCWWQESSMRNVTTMVNGTAVTKLTNVEINKPLPTDQRYYERIHPYMEKFAWTFIILVLLVTFFSVTGDYINVRMRRRVTRHLQKRVFHGNVLYRLTLDGRVDNFDQRMTSDLQALLDGLTCASFGNTSDYLAYPAGFCLSRMSFAFYNTLWGLNSSQQTEIAFSCIAMGLIAFIAYVVPMNKISMIFYRGQQYDGNFRATHTRSVLHCESITMYGGAQAEKGHADIQFKKIYNNARTYYQWQGSLMFLRLLATISQPSVGYMMLAIAAPRDDSSANALIKQVGGILEYLLLLPVIIARLAFAAGAAHRVGTFVEVLTQIEQEPLVQSTIDDDNVIELREITGNPPMPRTHEKSNTSCLSCLPCFTPTVEDKQMKTALASHHLTARFNAQRALFDNVSLKVAKGDSVVIMGPSGCGKSSLLRIIGGMWSVSSGTIIRPNKIGEDGMFFLPQRSYVFPGTLSSLICYPHAKPIYGQPELDNLLRECQLGHLIDMYGLDTIQDWTAVLSSSEQQRLAFTRMFYHKPMFCLTDEATSAMDLETESRLLDRCAAREITLISVAHRPTVIPHHKYMFRYETCTHTWNLYPTHQVSNVPKFPYPAQLPPTLVPQAVKLPQESGASGMGLLYLRRIGAALGMAIPSWKSKGAFLLFCMFCCMIINGVVIIIVFKDYGTSVIIKDVIDGNTQSAFNQAGVHVGINLVSSVVQSISAFMGAMIGLYVHRQIIKQFHQQYYEKNVQYHINRVKPIEGVDQRMVQDLGGMRESLAWFFGNPFAFQQFRLGLFPQLITFLVLMIYAFTIATSLTIFFLVVLFGSFLVQIFSSMFTATALETRQQREGELRLHYGRIGSYVESITFFRGFQQELNTAESLLETTIAARMKYILRAGFTTCPTVCMYYFLQNGDYVMAGLIQLYFTAGRLPAKDMYTILTFCVLMGKAAEQLVMALGGQGMLAGYTHRVMTVLEGCDDATKTYPQTIAHLVEGEPVSCKNLDVATPTEKAHIMIKDLNVTVARGQNLAITGPSGCGKSSLLRVLRGMWGTSQGTVTRPSNRRGALFVPQANYTTEGTLLQQVIYPETVTSTSDTQIHHILDQVGLGEVASRWTLHRIAPWDVVLSGGEQQRLGFARMLYHRPHYVVADEATSALDVSLERTCMQAVERAGITMISVCTRESVLAFHRRRLALTGDDGAYHLLEDGSHVKHRDVDVSSHEKVENRPSQSSGSASTSTSTSTSASSSALTKVQLLADRTPSNESEDDADSDSEITFHCMEKVDRYTTAG